MNIYHAKLISIDLSLVLNDLNFSIVLSPPHINLASLIIEKYLVDWSSSLYLTIVILSFKKLFFFLKFYLLSRISILFE